MRELAGIALALVLTAPAAAQTSVQSRLLNETTLLVAPEERVVVELASQGRLKLVAVAEVKAADAAPPPDPGHLALTLSMKGPAGATLTVQNGTDQPLDYEAALVRIGEGGRAQFYGTSVCTVLPKISGHEIWQDPFDAVAVRNFHKADHEGIVCR